MRRRNGFTLIQIVVTVAVFLFVGTWVIHSATSGAAVARQMACDTHLKAIALAVDTYRQDKGQYPVTLAALLDEKYIKDPEFLHCDEAPDSSVTYEDYYVQRAPRDNRALPFIMCPFHENRSEGVQAYLNKQVTQFSTQPAILTASNQTTVQRAGEPAAAGIAGMKLRGADVIRTAATGSAEVKFADGSTASIGGNCEVTLLQSFIMGKTQAPTYTLLRQVSGTVVYRVNHGSKFDVATPLAVCGALGTAFKITVSDGTIPTPSPTPTPLIPLIPQLPQLPQLPQVPLPLPTPTPAPPTGPSVTVLVTAGKVRVSTTKRSALAPLNTPYVITLTRLQLPGLPSLNDLLDLL